MINYILEGGDVVCSVNDMMKQMCTLLRSEEIDYSSTGERENRA